MVNLHLTTNCGPYRHFKELTVFSTDKQPLSARWELTRNILSGPQSGTSSVDKQSLNNNHGMITIFLFLYCLCYAMEHFRGY